MVKVDERKKCDGWRKYTYEINRGVEERGIDVIVEPHQA
jgi:hypothetical protein